MPGTWAVAGNYTCLVPGPWLGTTHAWYLGRGWELGYDGLRARVQVATFMSEDGRKVGVDPEVRIHNLKTVELISYLIECFDEE
jgi:hypothetical protein